MLWAFLSFHSPAAATRGPTRGACRVPTLARLDGIFHNNQLGLLFPYSSDFFFIFNTFFKVFLNWTPKAIFFL
jgi:hypothetical protein